VSYLDVRQNLRSLAAVTVARFVARRDKRRVTRSRAMCDRSSSRFFLRFSPNPLLNNPHDAPPFFLSENMYQKTSLTKKRVPFIRLLVDLKTDNAQVSEYDVHESRATRLVGDSKRFMTVSFTRDSNSKNIKSWLEEMTQPGKSITFDGQEYASYDQTLSRLHLLN
jgi:hypothetical protein